MSAPGQPPPMRAADPAALLNALLAGAQTLAGKSSAASSAAEAKDFADAALKCAQAVITLDPTRLAGGDTPEARKASLPDPAPAGGGAGKSKRPPTRDGDHDGRIGD